MYSIALSTTTACTCDGDPCWINIEVRCVEHEKLKGAETIVERRGVAMFRQMVILHRNYYRTKLEGKPLAGAVKMLCVQIRVVLLEIEKLHLYTMLRLEQNYEYLSTTIIGGPWGPGGGPSPQNLPAILWEGRHLLQKIFTGYRIVWNIYLKRISKYGNFK